MIYVFLKDFPFCNQYFEDYSVAYFSQNYKVMVISHHRGISKSRGQAVVSAVVFCSHACGGFLEIPFVGDLWGQLDCWLQGPFQPHRASPSQGSDSS